ncbi:hypothetical protein VTI74DRAFT_4297 [Chaetomium olivicolor]
MPYESSRTPAPPSGLVADHVFPSPARDIHPKKLQGKPRVSPSAFGSSRPRPASLAVRSMARQSLLLAEPADGHVVPPELKDDSSYIGEVLGQPGVATEEDIEQELAAKAVALGIELPVSGRHRNTPVHSSPDPEYAETLVQHSRTVSTGSDVTADTLVTAQTSDNTTIPPSSPTTEGLGRRRARTLSFSQYDRYISQIDPTLDQKFISNEKSEWKADVAVKPGTKRGVMGFTRSLASKLRGKRKPAPNAPMPCICCREEFPAGASFLHTLPCGHSYCHSCLAILVEQSIADECKMPPRCCTQPIPSAIIKAVLSREKQQLFLKSVVQFSTPWEARIFCPNPACGEFIPPAAKIDPKHPFEALCRHCSTRVCVMCKRGAHQLGQDCPEDHEADAVLKMGERSGWRRCYKCRTLVELAQGCTHITCRCKAQFCYICGAVWDPVVGCPNFCNGEEELERRRAAEEARQAEMAAEKRAQEKAAEAEAVERQEAERRTAESGEFRALREQQEAEMARFRAYEHRVREAMRIRQSQKKLAIVDRFDDQIEKMRDRHARTEQHLEDRQVMAEIELQASLEEKGKKVRLKLKYMEDYCRGSKLPGDTSSGSPMPERRVTERDLEQLRQQYCVKDGMERRHQSQINGLREKQAKAMEELVERHEKEMETLVDRRAEEIEDLAVEFANEAELLVQTFAERRVRMERRWEVAVEILRVELERREGKRFAAPPLPRWPDAGPGTAGGGGLGVVEEEEVVGLGVDGGEVGVAR